MGNNPAQALKHPEFTEQQPLYCEAQMKLVSRAGQAESAAWKPVSLALESKQLSLSGAAVEEPLLVPVNDRFEVLKENSNQQCLMFGGFANLSELFFLVKFESLHEFLRWSQKLKEAKRPKWQGLHTLLCAQCSLKFNVLRRMHHCRSCGRAVCASCSPALAILPHLGYATFQRICLRCGSQLQRVTVPRTGRKRSLSGIKVSKAQLTRSHSELRSKTPDRKSVQPAS